MYWLAGLVVLQLALEETVCAFGPGMPSRPRKLSTLLALGLLAGLSIALCLAAWQVWAWVVPIAAYRFINLLRVYVARLPAPRLRTVTTGAFNWLIAAQVATVALAWAAWRFGFGMMVFDVFVGLQLLAALVLLRTTLHTWRHAAVPGKIETKLSDKELPSVSVLVPARNETDDLRRCLEAITTSDYPKLEVLVLDDCSANRRTPEVIRSFAHTGVRFLRGEVPDETRWLAKNFAYEQLAREASGDVLLFCGVDARLSPHSVRQLVCLLEARQKDMLSVLPLRIPTGERGGTLLQAMRYYWEICPPRRLFKRPPVLSTCWLIRRKALEHMGGFESVSRSVVPEAPLARQAVITDAYSFIRSDEHLGIYSDKPGIEQYGTSVRVRYPQLHRRLELVAVVATFELAFLLGPFIGLLLAAYLPHGTAYAAVWVVTLLCLAVTYGLVSTGTRLSSRGVGWLAMPVAFGVDLLVLHISLWKYEFSTVDWKGRNVCIPVMQVEPFAARPKRPGRASTS